MTIGKGKSPFIAWFDPEATTVLRKEMDALTRELGTIKLSAKLSHALKDLECYLDDLDAFIVELAVPFDDEDRKTFKGFKEEHPELQDTELREEYAGLTLINILHALKPELPIMVYTHCKGITSSIDVSYPKVSLVYNKSLGIEAVIQSLKKRVS